MTKQPKNPNQWQQPIIESPEDFLLPPIDWEPVDFNGIPHFIISKDVGGLTMVARWIRLQREEKK